MDRKFNVTINRVNKVNGQTYPTTHQSVPADQIDFENMTFHFNDFNPAIPIVAIEERSQKLMEAETAYFEKFGTACE